MPRRGDERGRDEGRARRCGARLARGSLGCAKVQDLGQGSVLCGGVAGAEVGEEVVVRGRGLGVRGRSRHGGDEQERKQGQMAAAHRGA